MAKLIVFCRRRDELTHEEYAEMVLRDHVPIALRHHPALQAYVVNIVDHVPRGEPDFDSIAELTFASIDDFHHRLYDSPAGEEIVRADVARFLAVTNAYATTPHVHRAPAQAAAIGARNPCIKLICPIVRRDGMSHADFVDHWLHRHAPLALRHHPGMIGYVANTVDLVLTPDAPQLDGIGELYFASPESLRDDMFDSPAGADVIRRDIEQFIGHTNGYLATEYVQKRA